MLASPLTWFAELYSTPRPDYAPAKKEDRILAAGALLVGGWLFAFQLKSFYGLATTSDLYTNEQMSRSWLHGRWAYDNCFGNLLTTHAYLIAPLLSVFTLPFGAIGLFIEQAIAAGAAFIGLARILRLFGVPLAAAATWAMLTTIMPLTVGMYEDLTYGFHVEQLAPVMAIWLAYSLFQRRWVSSVAFAVLLMSIKEEMPIVAGVIAGMAFTEDLLRRLRPLGTAAAPRRSPINLPALAVVACALLAIPLLLWVIKLNPPETSKAVGNFGRLHLLAGTTVAGGSSLAHYIVQNWKDWLEGARARDALWLFGAATFGLIVLRPHFLLFGLATTLTSWLVQDNQLWPPRFAAMLGFCQIAGTICFASAYRFSASTAPGPRPVKILVRLLAAAGAVALVWAGLAWQFNRVRDSRFVYRLQVPLKFTPEEIRQADRVFAVYRQQSRTNDVTVAAPFLFRYAHDRNLFWDDGLHGPLRPVWALLDFKVPFPDAEAARAFNPARYEMVSHEGRFALYRARAPGAPLPASLTRDGWSGPVRLHVKFPPFTGVTSEPLLYSGDLGSADLLYVTYLAQNQIRIGHDSDGHGAIASGILNLDFGVEHTIDVSFAPLNVPAGALPPKPRAVRIKVDGVWLLRADRATHPTQPYQVVFGYNGGDLSSTSGPIFRGARLQPEHIVDFVDGQEDGEVGREAGGRGPLSVTFIFPAGKSTGAEPLVVTGITGQADVLYVKYLSGNRVRFGLDHWGQGTTVGDPVEIAPNVPQTIVVTSGALLPVEDSRLWNGYTTEEQERARRGIRVSLGGHVVLDSPFNAYPPGPAGPAVGENPVHASTCAEKFTGRIVSDPVWTALPPHQHP